MASDKRRDGSAKELVAEIRREFWRGLEHHLDMVGVRIGGSPPKADPPLAESPIPPRFYQAAGYFSTSKLGENEQ